MTEKENEIIQQVVRSTIQELSGKHVRVDLCNERFHHLKRAIYGLYVLLGGIGLTMVAEMVGRI